MIYIACDHNGTKVIEDIVKYFESKNININIISKGYDKDDYPDIAFKLCNLVKEDVNNLGILICGSGIGMSIAANKVKGIRAARCTSLRDARLSRIHNVANVICLSSSLENINEIIEEFIINNENIEERHINRVNKIINFENGEYNEL